MKNLFSIFLLFAAVLAASSCGTVRQTCPFSQSDSTRVEVRTQTVTKTDTVTVELPVIIERNVTLDTLSRLENAYAKSEAKVTNGFLHHSLETKPVKLPVEVKTETVYTLHETAAPNGYLAATDTTFQIERDGRVA